MDYDFRTYIWTIFGQVIFWLLHQGSYMANIWFRKYLDSDIRAYTWNMVWSKTILDYDLRLFYRVLQVKLYLVFFCWQRHRQLFFARQ